MMHQYHNQKLYNNHLWICYPAVRVSSASGIGRVGFMKVTLKHCKCFAEYSPGYVQGDLDWKVNVVAISMVHVGVDYL